MRSALPTSKRNFTRIHNENRVYRRDREDESVCFVLALIDQSNKTVEMWKILNNISTSGINQVNSGEIRMRMYK